jgi:hypothetical protein
MGSLQISVRMSCINQTISKNNAVTRSRRGRRKAEELSCGTENVAMNYLDVQYSHSPGG